MVLILLNQRLLSIKVMQLVLFRWRQVILNAIFCIKMVLFHRSYGHMNICKLSIVIISLRFSQSLPYSTFHMCWVHWYERFSSFRGRVSSLWLVTCWKYHITLFSLCEFFPLGFSYKVFNEAISTQGYVLSFIFSIEVFGGWYWNIWYIVLFSLCEFFLLRFLI